MKPYWRRLNVWMGTTVASSRMLSLKYTLEFSASINLFTSLVDRDWSWQNEGILLAAFYFLIAGIFGFFPGEDVRRFEQTAISSNDLEAKLYNNADSFGWRVIPSFIFTLLAIILVYVLFCCKGD